MNCRTWIAAVGTLIALGCSGTTDTDGGVDAIDGSVADGARDVAIVGTDVGSDVLREAGSDVGGDAALDASVDARLDSVSLDAGTDSPSDSPTDIAIDARADTAADASVDAPIDTPADAGGGVEGTLCTTSSECAPGLLCCYPCGIPGCMNRCTRPLPGTMRCPLIP